MSSSKEKGKTKLLPSRSAKEHFFRYAENRWKGGERLPTSVRVNSKLYLEFKPVAKACYGSVCRAVESFMAALVVAAEEKVYFSNTTKPVNIGRIVIERQQRPHRALEIREKIGLASEVFCQLKQRVYAPENLPCARGEYCPNLKCPHRRALLHDEAMSELSNVDS